MGRGEDRAPGALDPIRAQLRSSVYRGFHEAAVIVFRRGRETLPSRPTPSTGLEGVIMTLEQACPSEYQRAQCAFKDSMTHWNSAIRITYRISLRSSSMPEPRDPLLKVFAFN